MSLLYGDTITFTVNIYKSRQGHVGFAVSTEAQLTYLTLGV